MNSFMCEVVRGVWALPQIFGKQNFWKLHCLWCILVTLCHTLLICSAFLTNHNVAHRLNPTHKCKFPVDNIIFIMENTFNSETSFVTHNQQIILTQASCEFCEID